MSSFYSHVFNTKEIKISIKRWLMESDCGEVEKQKCERMGPSTDPWRGYRIISQLIMLKIFPWHDRGMIIQYRKEDLMSVQRCYLFRLVIKFKCQNKNNFRIKRFITNNDGMTRRLTVDMLNNNFNLTRSSRIYILIVWKHWIHWTIKEWRDFFRNWII